MSYHINSLVVHAQPGQLDPLKVEILALPGAEIHAQTPEGKLVVTLESEDRNALRAHTETLSTLPGVLSVALTYHREEEHLSKEMSQ